MAKVGGAGRAGRGVEQRESLLSEVPAYALRMMLDSVIWFVLGVGPWGGSSSADDTLGMQVRVSSWSKCFLTICVLMRNVYPWNRTFRIVLFWDSKNRL